MTSRQQTPHISISALTTHLLHRMRRRDNTSADIEARHVSDQPVAEQEPRKGPCNSMKFLLGGLGALTPVLSSLMILDVEILAEYLHKATTGNTETYEVVGYGLRVSILFILGGLWACLHKLEKDPKKLFQLGIVAPAMITGMINANNAYDARRQESIDQAVNISFSLISSAHADPKKKQPHKPSPMDRIVKGFLGK